MQPIEIINILQGNELKMSKFIGRKQEFKALNNLFNKRSASLVIIKGRRRIGKSRLLEEFGKTFPKVYIFSGLPPSEDHTNAESQRKEFAEQFKRQIPLKTKLKTEDWGDLFWNLSKHTKRGKILLVLDEISWMGSKDPDFLGKLKNSWDLYFKKNDELILAICGSVSAWIDRNILSSTGFLGRESLILTLDELSLDECSKFWNGKSKNVSVYEKLKVLSVTGGVPRYLEHINPVINAEDNIKQLCFDPSGILFKEFEKIFSDLFESKNKLYKKIVMSLSDGISDQTTICKTIGIKQSGDISEYLEDLIKSGFISRDFTWNIKNSMISNLSHYRLKDNYSRFYIKYILPNADKIQSGNMKNRSLINLPGWYTVAGLQVENLILSNRNLIKNALNIDPNDIVCDNPYFQKKTTKQEGCQIDYLIQTKHNILYICEIKYSKKEISTDIIEEIQDKIRRLNIPRYFSYRTVLIHINGVTEALEESQFFSHILCFADFFKDY